MADDHVPGQHRKGIAPTSSELGGLERLYRLGELPLHGFDVGLLVGPGRLHLGVRLRLQCTLDSLAAIRDLRSRQTSTTAQRSTRAEVPTTARPAAA